MSPVMQEATLAAVVNALDAGAQFSREMRELAEERLDADDADTAERILEAMERLTARLQEFDPSLLEEVT